jgi:purine-binding chemotaxis protein CheW
MIAVTVLNDSLCYVRFRVGEEDFAFPVENVSGVIRWQSVTPLPNVAPHILGLANLRGQTMPIADIAILIGMETTKKRQERFIMVTQTHLGQVGFLVDSVSEVLDLEFETEAEDVTTQSEIIRKVCEGVSNYEGNLIMILNLEKLVEIGQ